jgi:hypothetical protein
VKSAATTPTVSARNVTACDMPRLLIVHHSPTPTLRAIHEAVLDGATADGIVGVDTVSRPALEARTVDVVAADGYLLGTPANLGYMSGALKHFFDTTYNDCLDVTAGRPFGLWVHGESDTAGAIAGVEKIITGLRWRAAQAPLSLIGPPSDDDMAAAWELGASVAARLMSPA